MSTAEAKEMRESVQPAGKQANLEKEAHKESNADKDRSKDKVKAIVALDNGTMVETFKYLNYCQLAKNSFVSNRFHNLIRTHRHSLALLYVEYIGMLSYPIERAAIKIFGKELSSKEYNEWVIGNNYSKQAPIQDQIASAENAQNIPSGYLIYARASYNDLNNREWKDGTTVLDAQVEVNHENWPLFQHFVRLTTDPFIYIDCVRLTYQNDVLNLLAGAINSERRLQCKDLDFNLNSNSQKSITWAKNHVRCDKFFVYGEAGLNHDEALIDFLVTGACCTTSIKGRYHHVSKAMVVFVQKFLDLGNWDEYQGVQSIEGFHFVKDQVIQVWKKDYSIFIVKEERDETHRSTEHVFEFTNNAIGKKLQLIITIFDNEDDYYYCSRFGSPTFSLKINNL